MVITIQCKSFANKTVKMDPVSAAVPDWVVSTASDDGVVAASDGPTEF